MLESVHMREGCRGYWTRSKNTLAIKLKDKDRIGKYMRYILREVPIDLV